MIKGGWWWKEWAEITKGQRIIWGEKADIEGPGKISWQGWNWIWWSYQRYCWIVFSRWKIARTEDSVGTSSKSLTTLFWNLGNWNRGKNWTVPSFIDYKKRYYKEEKPDLYPDHVPENNNLFLQMIKNLGADLVLNCEAGSLVPYRENHQL